MMKAYNSNHIPQPNGTVQANFYQGWVNYLDENDQWQTIDTSLADVGDYFEMTKAPFAFRAPKLSTGTAEFISNNRWNVFQKCKILDAPFTMKIKASGVGEVAGVIETGDLGWGETSYVVYPNAYTDISADLIYFVHHGRAPRLRKLIRFHKALLLDTKFKFTLGFDEKTYTKNQGELWNEQSKLNALKLSFAREHGQCYRGVGLHDLFFWDKWSKRKTINSELVKTGANQFELTKIIPASLFFGVKFPCYTDATTSFYPDANPESTSVDGYAAWDGAGSTWATVRAAAGTSADDTDVFDMRISCSTTLNLIIRNTRGVILFDTSSITNQNFVTAANFKFTGITSADDQGLSFTLVTSAPASNTAVASGDYNIANFGTTHLCNDVTIASITDDVEKTTALNASGLAAISTSGITKLGFVFKEDIDNTYTWSSSAENRFAVYSAEYANKPTLEVTYFPIGPTRLPIMGVG